MPSASLACSPASSSACSPASFAAPSNAAAWKFLAGSAAIALNVSRLASVPSSRYFAVAGPNERSRRSRAAARTAAGPAVVRDRGVPDAVLACRADRGHPPAPAELVPQLLVRVRRGQTGEISRVGE